MTAADLKLFFRTVIKVVAGGPAVGTPGANRAAGVLSALDKLADVLFGAEVVNVPLLDPARDYPQGFQVRAILDGVSYPFYSVNGGTHPAPATFRGDASWGAVAPQLPPTQLTASYPLDYAQYLLRSTPSGLTPGVLYLLRSSAWNAGQGPTETVEVHAGRDGFARLGTLVQDSLRTPVTVDVAAGTYSTSIGSGTPADLRDIYDVPQALRDAVSGGAFNSGELQGSQPSGSLPGLEFTTTSYGFKYQRGAAGTLVWCRYPKG